MVYNWVRVLVCMYVIGCSLVLFMARAGSCGAARRIAGSVTGSVDPVFKVSPGSASLSRDPCPVRAPASPGSASLSRDPCPCPVSKGSPGTESSSGMTRSPVRIPGHLLGWYPTVEPCPVRGPESSPGMVSNSGTMPPSEVPSCPGLRYVVDRPGPAVPASGRPTILT